MKWTDRFTTFLDDAEQAALSLVARLGPWLSPIAPAYFIARAAVRHLSAPLLVAIAMGVAVEAVGIAAFIATMRAYTWNRERNARDAQAPARLGVVLIAVYLTVGIGLAVVVEVWPPLIPWAPAAFFILAGVAYLVLGMLSDQARREREAEAGRQTSRGASAFRKLAEQEYGLSRAQADALLVKAGDPLTAMDMLPESQQKASREPAIAVELAQSGAPMLAQIAAAPHICPRCARPFSTVQALNAHKRFCAGVMEHSANGNS